jgi:hypothetical protein
VDRVALTSNDPEGQKAQDGQQDAHGIDDVVQPAPFWGASDLLVMPSSPFPPARKPHLSAQCFLMRAS